MAARLCKWANKGNCSTCTQTQPPITSINDPRRDQIIFPQSRAQCHAILPLSGTFQRSLQSHLQYLVLMGNCGGSAVNEVWFPPSVHPRSRNRPTEAFFSSTSGTASTSCFTETYISYCSSSRKVCRDRSHSSEAQAGFFFFCAAQTLFRYPVAA